MSLNALKTKGIVFTHMSYEHSTRSIIIQGETNDIVPSINLLGIEFDSKWTWKNHISNFFLIR